MNKRLKIFMGMLIFLVFSASVMADQYVLLCLQLGEQVDFSECNPRIGVRTCNYGTCMMCSKIKDNGIWCPVASLSPCNSRGLPCTYLGDNATIDTFPPNITLHYPVQDGLYDDNRITVNVEADEKATWYFMDNLDSSPRWTYMCRETKVCEDRISFNEGFNNITIRAADRLNNKAYYNVSFYVDSEEPKIKKTEPRSGYASGDFYVEFSEENPELLILNYGNDIIGHREEEMNLDDCYDVRRDKGCGVSVVLDDYDGQKIEYWFTLTDIIGNVDESNHISLDVDATFPVINNNPHFYEIDGKYVYFDINITEENFDEADYIDLDDAKQKEKILCNKLKEGRCQKKVPFKDGFHDLLVQVKDEAGNTVAVPISFFTDSKAPKISKTEPKKGYADGNFEVQFKEENPQSLFLNYGNLLTGYRNAELALENDCYQDRKKYYCDIYVVLDDYDGQKIEYWFNLTDIAGVSDESKHVKLDVDTSFPIIGYLNYIIDGRYVTFDIGIIEENLDEVSYIDYSDRKPRWRRLCSKLKDGKCIKRKSFRNGFHNLSIQVTDEAGNAVAQSIDFVIDY